MDSKKFRDAILGPWSSSKKAEEARAQRQREKQLLLRSKFGKSEPSRFPMKYTPPPVYKPIRWSDARPIILKKIGYGKKRPDE
jgi:hypothetical protein